MKLYSLWLDEGIQRAYEHRSEFHLDDNAPYFLSRMDMLTKSNYIPSVHDILRSRKKTTGIIDEQFTIGDKVLKVVDVGGQRNERRKWISCVSSSRCLLLLSLSLELLFVLSFVLLCRTLDTLTFSLLTAICHLSM